MKFISIHCYRWGGSMKAMFWYRMVVLIFFAKPSDSFEIWLWIYICHVSDVYWPNSLKVESWYPIIFSTIAPPSWSECAHIMLGSTPLSFSLRVFAAVLAYLTLSPLATSFHASLRQMLQRRLSSITLLLRMSYTLLYRATTAPFLPFDSWCKVCPILPFSYLGFLALLSPPQAVCSVNFSRSPHPALWTVLSLLLSLIFRFF